jgi:hypothetical protein
MHTALARDACRGTLGIQYDGEDGVLNAYLDTTGQFCWWLAVRKHVGLMVVVADTYVVETDPSISSRSWIT